MSWPQVLRNRDFFALWLATLLSVLALSTAWVTESWYAIKALQRESDFGYILICAMAPRLLFMLAGGVLADRWSKTRIIALSLLLRAGLLLLLGWLMGQHAVSFTLLLLFALLYGVLDACYWPARDALLPGLLPASQLPQANALMLISGQVGMIAGPAIAGALLVWLPYGEVLILQGLLLAASTALLPRLPQHTAPAPAGAGHNFAAQWREGWHYVRQHPLFSVLMCIFAVANVLFMGPLQQSMPLLVTRDLGGDAGAYSVLLTCFGGGMALGGVLSARLQPPGGKFLFIMLMLLLESLLLAALAWTPHLYVVAACTLLLGCCVACNNIPTLSLLQSQAAPDKIGRVMGLNDTISMGLTPLSYALVALLLGAGIGHKTILLCAGITMFVFCLAMLLRHRVLIVNTR